MYIFLYTPIYIYIYIFTVVFLFPFVCIDLAKVTMLILLICHRSVVYSLVFFLLLWLLFVWSRFCSSSTIFLNPNTSSALQIDCDKTIMVTLKHDDKLQDGSECLFQVSMNFSAVWHGFCKDHISLLLFGRVCAICHCRKISFLL